MPVGEAFTPRQIDEMARAAQAASERCGLRFSVFIGQSEGDPAVFAERLLAGLGDDAPRSVLIHVDPGARRLEIVTGREAAQQLNDRACGLASLSMTSAFSGGDIVGGVVTGLRMLGDSVFWSAAARARRDQSAADASQARARKARAIVSRPSTASRRRVGSGSAVRSHVSVRSTVPCSMTSAGKSPTTRS